MEFNYKRKLNKYENMEYKYFNLYNIITMIIGCNVSIIGTIWGSQFSVKTITKKLPILEKEITYKKTKFPIGIFVLDIVISLIYAIIEIISQKKEYMGEIVLFYLSILIWIIIIAIISSIITICIIKIQKDTINNTLNPDQINKRIIDNTAEADCNKPIKIFGGDLNFFGGVINGSIINNEQINQIIKMKFKNIKILCVKPTDLDKEIKLRIGYLLNMFTNHIEIKFYNQKLCSDCNDYNCSVKKICDKCDILKTCRYNKIDECGQIKKQKIHYCYNPDVNIRGRIVTRDVTQTEFGVITIKEDINKYGLMVYDTNTKEFNLYKQIWDVWWQKCEEDSVLLDEYKNLYDNWQNEHPKFEAKKKNMQKKQCKQINL